MSEEVVGVDRQSHVILACALALGASRAAHAVQSISPERRRLTERARYVVSECLAFGDIVASADTDGLLRFLRHEDNVVRWWAVDFTGGYSGGFAGKLSKEIRRYAGLERDRRGRPVEPGPAERAGLRATLERNFNGRPTPWVGEARLADARDRGTLVFHLTLSLITFNNNLHFPFFGDAAGQAEVSLLCLALAGEARGTKEYRSSVETGAAVISHGDAYTALRNTGVVFPREIPPPDAALDAYLDGIWAIIPYMYFHAFERRFYLDKAAWEAGIPSADYRMENPWAEDEGPNLKLPERLTEHARRWLEAASEGTDESSHAKPPPPAPEQAQAGPSSSAGRWLAVALGAVAALGALFAWFLLRRARR